MTGWKSHIVKQIFIYKLFQEMHPSASVFNLPLYVIAALVDQLSAVDSLIDSMNLVHEDGETFEDLFKPSKIPNPHFQRLYQVRWTIWYFLKTFFLKTFQPFVLLWFTLERSALWKCRYKSLALKYVVTGDFCVVPGIDVSLKFLVSRKQGKLYLCWGVHNSISDIHRHID